MIKIESMPIDDVINRIINLNDNLRKFWTTPEGWAPISAAELLSKSRLDWQVSLSKSLKIWIEKYPNNEEEGMLILAWVNLGSLVEGTMKLFLSVYYNDYKNDLKAIRKRNKIIEPDILQLEQMRLFFKNRIFRNEYQSLDPWILHVQNRRNAIHAYKNRDLGNFDEFKNDLRLYLKFLRYINSKLPYPGDEYVPSEMTR